VGVTSNNLEGYKYTQKYKNDYSNDGHCSVVHGKSE
jgi:hypothetical protein